MEKALTSIQQKVLSRTDAIKQIQVWKAAGERVVFTNGCFDLLHKGHVSYLALARGKGDRLVVGLNADASVKRLGKGDDRPINREADRAFVLAGLAAVDLVVVFEEDTPLSLITDLQPDVLLKGGDYDPHESDASKKTYIVGSELVRERGGQVDVIPFVPGYSTTGILNKSKK